jgi:hypothetical protein
MPTTGEHDASGSTVVSDREQLVLAVKIAVGIVVGFLMMGVVGPIVLAVIVGLAAGH